MMAIYGTTAVLTNHHQWFTNHERGSLKRELASIYHYYLHPENCPDGILRYVPLLCGTTLVAYHV